MDDFVVVETVPTVMEASLICGVLRNVGIRCLDRPTNFAAGANDGWPSGGWREIVVRPGTAETQIQQSSVSEQDQSDELRNYPADLLSSPLAVRDARITFVRGGAAAIIVVWLAAAVLAFLVVRNLLAS